MLGRITWDQFAFADDPDRVEQEVFNIVYHLKQSYTEVMHWPASQRRSVWKRVLDQYEFEKKRRKDEG